MSLQYDFSDIAPFDDDVFADKIASLVKEPGFEHAVRYVMPQVDYSYFVKTLLTIKDKETFQHRIMWPFLEMLSEKTTAGITSGGIDNLKPDMAYTFVTNHRDIVLDASFLNLCFLRAGLTTSEVAIGNNLLIYEWISDLVKLNKSFIVKRGLRLTKAYEASRHLSAYIHYAVDTKHQSVWIAQREGRAKDSNDLTQEALVKMLGIAGDGTITQNIRALNVVPVSISYEYDPNDFLKAREFLLRRLDPEYKKSQRDDLFSMETGLLQYKGRVHFEIGRCINDELDKIDQTADRIEAAKKICSIIDCNIHLGYHIYPVNYIAYDILHNENKPSLYREFYTEEDKAAFETYIEKQLDKVTLPDSEISELDRAYMCEMMYNMYANPLKNKVQASSRCESL